MICSCIPNAIDGFFLMSLSLDSPLLGPQIYSSPCTLTITSSNPQVLLITFFLGDGLTVSKTTTISLAQGTLLLGFFHLLIFPFIFFLPSLSQRYCVPPWWHWTQTSSQHLMQLGDHVLSCFNSNPLWAWLLCSLARKATLVCPVCLFCHHLCPVQSSDQLLPL